MSTRAIITVAILCIKIFSQEFNTLTIDDITGKPMLIGNTTLEAFDDTSFSWWWNSSYNMYEVDTKTCEQLNEQLDSIDIKIIMGTWCSDSRTEVPHFFKILDKLRYPVENVILINVDREKKGIEDEVKGLNIKFVPTFIFSKDGKELGRIVELPYKSLEKDMFEFFLGQGSK